MAILHIEVHSKKSVMLQTRASGDVEVIVAKTVPGSPHVSTPLGLVFPSRPSGVVDDLICVIPHHRLKLVADFLLAQL